MSYAFDVLSRAWEGLRQKLPPEERDGEVAMRFGFLLEELHDANHRVNDAINKDGRPRSPKSPAGAPGAEGGAAMSLGKDNMRRAIEFALAGGGEPANWRFVKDRLEQALQEPRDLPGQVASTLARCAAHGGDVQLTLRAHEWRALADHLGLDYKGERA